MDVSRLLAVIHDIEQDVKAGPPKFLANHIQQYIAARDSPTVDNTPAILKAFNAVERALDESVFLKYPPSKAAVLKAIGGDRLFGEGFRERLDNILAVSGQTTAGIVTGLTNLQTDVETFRKACAQARTGLEGLGLAPHIIPVGEFEVGVLIPEHLVDSKLSTFVKELSTWNQIVRAFQEVAGDEEREVTVAGLASGSYEIYIPLGVCAATLFAKTIDKVLEWYLKILEIRKRRLELKELGAPVAEVSSVQKYEREYIKEQIQALAKELVKEAHPKVDTNRRNELETHLTVSIRQIARFVDRGGEVEVDSTPPTKPEEPATPTEEGQPGQDQEYDRLKSEHEALRSEFERISKILKSGSALRRLPERSEPILQLSEAESEEDSPPPEKPAKKKG